MPLILAGGCAIDTSNLSTAPRGPDAAAGRDQSLAAVSRADTEAADEPTVGYAEWSYHGAPGRVITSPHFQLYTTLRRRSTLQQMPLFYERCLEHYTTALGPLPDPETRLVAFVFGDSRQWKNKTREMLPDQADAFMTLGRGGFTTRGTSVLFWIGPRDTWAIAAHEGWHQYTQSTFRHPLPVWLEEGLATYMEAISATNGRRLLPWLNEERRDALRQADRRDRLIELPELLRRSPQAFLREGRGRLLVYYAQVWALARFLAEGEGGKYRPALEELLADAAHGRMVGRLANSRVAGLGRRHVLRQSRSGPSVLLEYFNPDLDQLASEYQQYVHRLTRRRGPERRAMESSGDGSTIDVP